VADARGVEPVKKTVIGLSLIVAFLFSATAIVMYVEVASANPAIYLPVIEIKSDGRVVPSTPFIKQDGDTYTLIGDISQKYAILIRRSNIVFNGAGYSVKCSSYPVFANRGLSLEGVTNVTVKDITVTGFSGGYSDKWLGDVAAENATNSVFLRVTTEVLRLVNSNFNTIAESNISSDNSLRLPELGVLYSNNNTITRNNIASLHLDFGYNNTFFKNNFLIDHISVNEANFWDNGSVGNYWSDYKGADANGDGIGDTPYVINAENQDRYPLMNPWDPTIPYDTVPPPISVSSPVHRVYNVSSVPLVFSICEASSSMSYSLDGQDNVTVTGNVTLSGLPNGAHNLTVYVTDRSGNVGASETMFFDVDVPESFPAVPVAAASGASVAVVGVGLLAYFRKRNHRVEVTGNTG
jgi:hypothetical protein